jgi:hypothetical protein
MDTSFISHRSEDGRRAFAVLSLGLLRSLDGPKRAALEALGIHSLGDLLHWLPVHRARLLLAIQRGLVAHDLELAQVIRDGADRDPATFPGAATSVIDGVGAATEAVLRDVFVVRTVAELAVFAPFVEAERLMSNEAERFHERASAPDDLVPMLAGSIASTTRLASIVRESELPYTRSFHVPADDPIAGVLISDRPLQLGYVALHAQRWIHLGVHLGEVLHTIGLAPGESRRISVIDWHRRQSDRRDEATAADEDLGSSLLQNRALDDVVSSVAREHQWGGSLALSATNVAAVGGVAALAAAAGMAGAVGGAVTVGITGAGAGAAVGAAVGSVVPGVGNAVGAVVGASVGGAAGVAAGAAVGAATGVLSVAALAGAAGAAGVMVSDTHGLRSVLADERQNIMQLTGQKSSLARSLRSTVLVESDQSEAATGRTRLLANHNHSHTLNLCYYELLHHYRVELETERLEPFLLLPYAAIDFKLDTIVEHWDALRPWIDRDLAAAFDDIVASGIPRAMGALVSEDPAPTFENLELTVVRGHADDAKPSVVGVEHVGYSLRPYAWRGGGTLPTTFDRYAEGSPGALPVADVRTVVVRIGVHNNVRYRVEVGRIRVRLHNGTIVDVPGTLNLDWKDSGPGTGDEFRWDVDLLAFVRTAEHRDLSRARVIDAVVKQIRARRYRFTRILLGGLEPEQLVDILDAVVVTSGGATVPLRDLADLGPIGTSPHGLLLRLRANTDLPDAFAKARDYAEELDLWLEGTAGKGRTITSDRVYLPSGGVFVEGVLGRANASEKVDLTRFWNWQDSPIPSGPEIEPLDLGSRAEPVGAVTPTPVSNVLNIVPPVAFPEPSGLARVLDAVSRGSMFRDMSGAPELTSLMADLASVAERAASSAVDQAGSTGTRALEQAVQLADKVADLSATMARAASDSARSPENVTVEGGRENLAREATEPTTPLAPEAPQEFAVPVPTDLGSSRPRPPTRATRQVPFILTARWSNEAVLEADFNIVVRHEVTGAEEVLGLRTQGTGDSIAGYASRMLTNPPRGDWSVMGNAIVARPQPMLFPRVSVPLVGGDHLELELDLTRSLSGREFLDLTGEFTLLEGMQTVRMRAVAVTVPQEVETSITIGGQAGGGISTEVEAAIENELLRVLGGKLTASLGLQFSGQVTAGQTTSYKITYLRVVAIKLTQSE